MPHDLPSGGASTPLDILSFWNEVLAPAVPLLRRDTWNPWKAALRALFGLSLSDSDLNIYRDCTGRREPTREPVREGWFIVGRRGGKSYVMALLAVYLSTVRRYELAPGERGVLMVIAQDRRQARVVRRYVGALLRNVPMLRSLIHHETKETVQLTTGVDIEIHTASFRSVRGYSVVGAICDEISFWPTDAAADPDREILAALRPAMATTGGLLVAISSPYARRGELWRMYRKHHGKESDVLIWVADTRTMNATVPQAVVDRAFEEDAVAAMSEYGRAGRVEFRSDVETFVSREAVEAVVVLGRLELPPVASTRYHGFLDFAGGSGQDSATLAIAHAEESDGQKIAILDAVREVRPPFSPEQVCRDFAGELKRYRITRATADRYAGDFPAEQMRKHVVTLKPSEKVKSAIYKELLPMVNSGTVELLDLSRLQAQLAGLERRVARGGRDSIDHGPGGHDDVINAAAGALVLTATQRRGVSPVWGRNAPARVLEDRTGDDDGATPKMGAPSPLTSGTR